MWPVLIIGTSVVIILITAFVVSLVVSNRRLKSERDFASDIFNTAGVLIVVLDKNGAIIRFNKTCELATGFRTSEIIGKEFNALISITGSSLKEKNFKSNILLLSNLPAITEGLTSL